MSSWDIYGAASVEQDIRAIHGFIAYELGDEDGAVRVATRLNDAIGSLAYMPSSHRLHPLKRYSSQNIRYVAAGSYLILFRVIDEEHRVHVLRILHSAQMPPEIS